MPSSLIFKDAEKARDAICAEDQKKIRQLYSDWADEVGKRAEYYHSKETASSYWQEQQMLELQRQLTEQSKVIANQIYTGTKESMYTVADSVVGCNAKYLSELGFPSEGLNAAFTSVPTQVVNNLVTGQIYEGGWNLSSAIWSDNEQTLHDIYQIVAQGRAMNMSAYEVSKMLEQYVNPNKAKQWNLTMSDGRRIYKRSVDYNAQRLTRTLTQHAYQQGVIQCAKDNPFIQSVIWRANGSRTCELCLDRDGKEYRWDEVPMDHPNGMCTMEPKIDMDKTLDQLADWFNADDGEYPEIDRFASKFGYVPNVGANSGNPSFNRDKWDMQFRSQADQKARFEGWTVDFKAQTTVAERRSVKVYTGESYKDINRYMRGLSNIDATSKAGAKTINDAENIRSALAKASTPEQCIVRRGSSFNSFSNMLGEGKITMPKGYAEQEAYKQTLAATFASRKDELVGTVVTDPSFMSTTPIEPKGFSKGVNYIINVPQGAHAAYISPLSQHKNESEMLLQAGSKFVVEDIVDGGVGNLTIYLSMLP